MQEHIAAEQQNSRERGRKSDDNFGTGQPAIDDDAIPLAVRQNVVGALAITDVNEEDLKGQEWLLILSNKTSQQACKSYLETRKAPSYGSRLALISRIAKLLFADSQPKESQQDKKEPKQSK